MTTPSRIGGTRLVVMFALATSSAIAAVPATGRAQLSWTYETVDPSSLGAFSSQAFADGVLHASYMDNNRAAYARRSGGAWTTEPVDPRPGSGLFGSMVLDGSGAPHLCYFVDDPFAHTSVLTYAHRDGAVWVAEPVEVNPGGNPGNGSASIAIDADGRPAIAYRYVASTLASQTVHFATRIGASWVVETPTALPGAGNSVRLKFDALGNPWIGYGHASGLACTRRVGGFWTTEPIEGGEGLGTFTSLAIGADGEPRIAAWDFGDERLYYAARSGGSWSIEPVDPDVGMGYWCALALDPAGLPWIAYASDNDLPSTIRCAHRLPGGTWDRGDVGTGLSPSIAFESGFASVMYGTADNTLRRARSTVAADVAATGGADHGLRIVAMWPNPARGALSVSFATPRAGNTRIEVLDPSGRRRFLHEGRAGRGMQQVEIAEVGRLETGIYWIRLSQGDLRSSTRVCVLR